MSKNVWWYLGQKCKNNDISCPSNLNHDGKAINSLWPGDTIWRHGTRSALAQVMACCLTAPSHYLNQCWLIIGEVPWHSSQGIISRQVKIPINKRRLKIAVLKWNLGPPGANELMQCFTDDVIQKSWYQHMHSHSTSGVYVNWRKSKLVPILYIS